MLQGLINFTEEWPFLLIEDDLSKNGRGLLLCFVHELLQRQYEVHLIAYDYLPEFVRKSFPTYKNLICHDGTNSSWLCNRENTNDLTLNPETDLAEYFSSIHYESSNIAVVIDSLSTLAMYTSPATICQKLHAVRKGIEKQGRKLKMLGLLHRDIHDNSVKHALEYISSTVLSLGANNANNPLKLDSCSLIHRRINGKVMTEEETFKIKDFKVIDIKRLTSHRAAMEKTSKSDPTAGLSFKLSLDDTEKEARSQLVLPYTRSGQLGSGDGDIIYEADANDDFDEEDPDDDLNI